MESEILRDVEAKEKPFGEELERVEAIILRSMNEGVITLECNGDISHVNPAAMRILGYSEAELKGKKFSEAFNREPENQHFKKIVGDAIERGLHTTGTETLFKRSDGQKIDLSVATSYLEVDTCTPSLENCVVVFRDITPFKAMERARLRAVNHLSHELKTPLAIIEASLNSLARDDASEEFREKALKRIERHLHRLKELQEIVEQIMTPRKLRLVQIAVDRAIEEMLEEIRAKSIHRAVKITTALEKIETGSIDPDILSLVVGTLVKNAIEATPNGGEVVVRLKREAAGIVLRVEDHGVGIAVRDAEFIFEGFHHTQATNEYSTKNPYDFNAGGKGLELLRLKVLSEQGYFGISFESSRSRYISTAQDNSSGRISDCAHVVDLQGCKDSGGTTFTVVFPRRNSQED